MAAQTFLQALIGVGAYDISAASGYVQTSPMQVITKEVPSFAAGGFMPRAVGLRAAGMKVAGWSDFASGGFNQQITTSLLGSQQLLYVATPGSAAGDPAVLTRGTLSMLSSWGGKIGEPAAFVLEAEPDTAAVEGWLAAPLTARTTTANGASVAQAGPSAAQRVYAGLQVTAASGTTPSLTVKIQSAPLANFASPTDRITFSAASAAGWQWSSTGLGAITDGFWRATWTISGTSPSFTFAVVFGVAP
jgi:hypothetical protein